MYTDFSAFSDCGSTSTTLQKASDKGEDHAMIDMTANKYVAEKEAQI